MNMNVNDLKELHSVCWYEKKLRCECVGISNLKITEKFTTKNIKYWLISFSDDDGDPSFTCRNLNDLIYFVGDGTWSYGLYKNNN